MREESYSFVYYEGDELSAVQSGLALGYAAPIGHLLFFRVSFFLSLSLSLRPHSSRLSFFPCPLPSTPFHPLVERLDWERPIVNVKINSPRPFQRSSSARVLRGPRVRKHIHHQDGLYRTVESERAAN